MRRLVAVLLSAAACAGSLPVAARTVDRTLPLAEGGAFDRKHPPKVEGREIVCDNGESTDLRNGWTWPVKLAQTNALPFSVLAESRAEAVPGGDRRDYSLYLDIRYADGTSLYGQVAAFDPDPAKGWQRKKVTIAPDKPVEYAYCHLLFRNQAGRVRFREPVLRTYEGVDVVQYDTCCQVLPKGCGQAPRFLVRDAAAEDRGFVTIAPGGSAEAVTLAVSEESARAGATAFDVTVRSNDDRDRAVSLVYALPIPGNGPFVWHEDPRTSETLRPSSGQRRVTSAQGAGEGPLSRWPFGAVTADGKGLALGYDPTAPAIFRVTANPKTRELLIAFDMGFAKEKRDAHFRFVRFGFDGAQAFRGALAAYQRIFPENHVVRLKRHGLWMAFRKISGVQGWEDFGFAVKEGDNEPDWDDAHGLVTFHYTEPTSWWMTMKGGPGTYTYDDCLAEAERQAAAKKPFALAWKASAYQDANGKTFGSVRDTPWCKGAVWSLCSLPGIRGGEYDYKLRGPAWEKRYAKPVPAGVDGEYIDSAEPYMTPPLDYTRAHFAASVTPLAYDPQTKRPGVAKCLSVYEYVRTTADRCHALGRYLMGNGIPYNWPWLVPFSDFGGQEDNWMDRKTGAWKPKSDKELLYRRAMSGGKPYCFLMNTDFDRFTPEMVEKYMQRALAYGLFPCFFSPNASGGHYFTRPELYNRDRPLFKKYVPLCRKISEAGWRPVNALAASETDGVYVEQFGERYLTVFNSGTEKKTVRLRVLNAAREARELVEGGCWRFADGVADVDIPGETVRILEF